jgi:hypothetical protein
MSAAGESMLAISGNISFVYIHTYTKTMIGSIADSPLGKEANYPSFIGVRGGQWGTSARSPGHFTTQSRSRHPRCVGGACQNQDHFPPAVTYISLSSVRTWEKPCYDNKQFLY